jgi:hypothetical protein
LEPVANGSFRGKQPFSPVAEIGDS